MAIHPNSRMRRVCQQVWWLRIWDSGLTRGSTIAFPMPINVQTKSIAWSPDGEKIAVHMRTADRNAVVVYDVAFALATKQSELLMAARRYLRREFAFSQSVCRQLFEGTNCPDRAGLVESGR